MPEPYINEHTQSSSGEANNATLKVYTADGTPDSGMLKFWHTGIGSIFAPTANTALPDGAVLKFWKTAVRGSWQPTLLGFIIAVGVVVQPIFANGVWPTKSQWLAALGAALGGLLVKQHNKVGTGQPGDPIRG